MSLRDEDLKYVWHPFTQMAEWEPLVIERGDGNFLIDEDGKRYFDAVSSLWCNVHGHNHPVLNRALGEQASKIAHSTFLGLSHAPAIELARQLIQSAPRGLTRVFYSDSGSSAVEIALKQSFQFWQLAGKSSKTKFVRLDNAYHGDTLGAVAVGGIDIFHKIFGPLLTQSIKVRSPYEPSWSSQASRGGELALMELDQALANADQIAAVIMEPLMQGAAGMLPHPVGFLAEVAKRCEAAGVHLIVDEVATGFGRTGTLFACSQEGVTPDFLCLAKGISGGYLPLAATLCKEAIYCAFLGERAELKHFFHGHTYTANPLACAVGIASLGLLRSYDLKAWATRVQTAANTIVGHPQVRECRMVGGMVGIEVGRRRDQAFDWHQFAGAHICQLARAHGVMMRPLGDVLVWMPPLTATTGELDLLAVATAAAIDEFCASRG